MTDECPKKCKWLRYNEKASSPSYWIGEGYYVWMCDKYNEQLSVYLHDTPFRCMPCRDNK